MALCMMLAGCGSTGEEAADLPYTVESSSAQAEEESRSAQTQEVTASGAGDELSLSQIEDMLQSGQILTDEILNAEVDAKLAEKGYAEAEAEKESREAVITLGIYYNFVDSEQKTTIGNFNLSQDKYWLDIKAYNNYSDIVMDIMRGTGADIFYLDNMPFDLFADKGVLEDLTPYFEKSDVISREQVLDCIWRAGSVDGKYVGVIPYFNPSGYLVEKGVAMDGGWTLEDYFALGEKYPTSKLEERVQDPDNYLLSFMSPVIQSLVDWEEKTCNFDSEEFGKLLSAVKANAEKKYESKSLETIAERLYEKEYLTKNVLIYCDPGLSGRRMDTYLDVRDTFLEDFDIVGFPNNEGIPMYDMMYYEMYGINAASRHKDAAWAFIEYLFSEEYQSLLQSSGFTVRADILEEMLDAEVSYVCNSELSFHENCYTGEKVMNITVEPFTEEDKQNILYIIEHCYRNTMKESDIYYIIREEMAPYFEGDKSLDEVVDIIQNRSALYLDEYRTK